MIAASRSYLRWLPWLGALQLTATSLLYTYFGWTSYPRQEWLLELLVACVFILPVLELVQAKGGESAPGGIRWKSSVRILGLMLLFHSLWDCVHWPLLSWVDTPVDPRLPKICPEFDIPLGIVLLLIRW